MAHPILTFASLVVLALGVSSCGDDSRAVASLPPPSPIGPAVKESCPITIPEQPGFVAPGSHPANYPHEEAVWYGTAELWTALDIDGSHGPRKTVLWSANFPGGRIEQKPQVSATYTQLDAAEPTVRHSDGPGTNAHTDEEGWFMIAGLDPEEPGCWQVEATYKGAGLTYVYEIR